MSAESASLRRFEQQDQYQSYDHAPQSRDPLYKDKEIRAVQEQHERDRQTGSHSHSGGFIVILVEAPQDRAKDSASIERKAGENIESGEHPVNESEVSQYLGKNKMRRSSQQCLVESREQCSGQKTGGGTYDRDLELGGRG